MPMAVRKMIMNPLTTFVLCEVNVLLTAFVVLYPATYAQAAIDEREGVEESNTLRSLKLPAIVAEFAVGSKVAMHRLGRVIVRDFALFMTVYLVGVGYFLSSTKIQTLIARRACTRCRGDFRALLSLLERR